MLPEAIAAHPLAAALEARLPGAATGGTLENGELVLHIDPARIVEAGRFLKTDHKFIQLTGVTCVDWHPREPRFEIVYLLRSYETNVYLRLKSTVAESIDSVYEIWRSADWYEREIFDLFGVKFHNHPDLRRILMPENWKGHPLRKDYPVHGFKYSYAEPQ